MPQACAEVTAELLFRLRRKFAHLVTVRGEPQLIRESYRVRYPISNGDTRAANGPPLFLATLESPLISDMTPHVEVVVDGAGLRFKAAREV